MVEVSSLSVVVAYDDSAVQTGVPKTSQTISGLGSSIQTALGAAALAGGAAIAAGLGVGIKAAGDLQQSVANISTIKPEIDTSAVFGALNEMSTRIPATASELGASLYNVFSSMDVGQEAALQLVETFAKGAAGAGTSAETFGTAAMGVMNAYGLSAKDASAISDMFFDTINKGVVTGDELAASLGPVTQSAKAAGVAWQDLGPMIAAVTKEGGPAAQNMNNLNNLFQKFTTTAAQTAMNKMGVATTDAAGKFREVPAVLTDLKAHLATLSEAERAAALQEIFPDAQARIGAQTLMSQIDFVNEALKTNQTASGSTAAAYEKMSATFNSQSKLLMNNLMAIGTTIGAEVLPHLTPLITAFSQALPAAFQTAKDAIGTVQQVLAGDWAPADSINPFVNAVGKAAVMLRDTFGPAISAVSGFVRGTLLPAIQQLAAPLAAFSAGFLATVAASGLVTAAIAGVTAVLGFLLTPLGAVAVAVGLLAAAWTTNFGGIQQITQQFVAIVQQALSGDVAGAFTAFIALVVTVGQQIVAQLLVWGQAFVDWIAPMIPPMLAAATDLAAQLLGWIVAQVPVWTTAFLAWATEWVQWLTVATPLLLAAAAAFIAPLLAWVQAQVPIWTAQLLTWGAEFVAWIAPQIDPMVRSLGTLALAMIDWIIAQVPTIVENLVKWGLLFGAWVVGSAIPELVKALPGILTTLNAWIVDAQAALGERLIAFGKAWVDGIFKGFTDAWAIIGPKITETIKSVFVLPSFGGGGGVPGATQMSAPARSPGGTHASAYMDLINKVSAQEHEDAALVAAIMDTEGSGANSTSPAGARGLMQVMPNYVLPGENPFDPETSIRQGIRAIQEKRAAVGNDPGAIAGAYFGYGTDAGGMTTGGYRQQFLQNYNRYKSQPTMTTGGADLRDMQKIPLGQAPGGTGDPGHWPVLLDQVHNDLLPQWLQDMDAMTQAGQQAFTTVAQSGQTEGTALVSASTDSLGNVTRIYTENGVAIGATITDAAGVVVNSFGSMGTGAVAAAGAMATGVTGQAAVMATGVTEQANLMTSGALTSVTSLGTGILTTVQATSGTTIATVTDMQGQVTSQYATLANGAQLSMDGLSAGVMTSTTDLGTGVLTIMQDTSGNYIATVTDLAGNVVSQYTQLGTDVVAAATEQTAGVTEQAQTMADTVLTSVTDLGDGTLTIVRDTSGEMVATITDMSGQVVETYSSMGSDVQGTMEEFASTTAEQFHSVEGPAGDATKAMEEVGNVQIDAPDVSDVIGAMKDIQKAADRARSAVETVDGKGGKKGGSGKKDPDFGKAVGGPVNMGQTYLVGEEGPELFTPGSSGTIIPNNRLDFGGGGSQEIVFVIRDPSGRTLEEWFVTGRELATRRGRV